MSTSRKRKAIDQLSPYSNLDEDDVVQETPLQPITERKRAKANIGSRNTSVVDPESLKGVLANIKILTQNEDEDKLSGLNRCFLNAVSRTLKHQSNKDLRKLFKQYESFIKMIENEQKMK